MEGSKLILTITRALQLLFAAVVLGTSVSLYKFLPKYQNECNALYKDSECNFFGLIHAVGFGCFVGALGLVDSIAGIVAVFLDVIPFIILLGADALASVVYLAGGLAMAIILSKSAFDGSSGSRWTEIKSDNAFMFLGFIITLVIVGLTFMWRRSGKLHSAV